MNSRECRKSVARGGIRSAGGFMDDVETEVEAIDLYDFALFCHADGVAVEPRPNFAAELRERLRALVRGLYAN